MDLTLLHKIGTYTLVVLTGMMVAALAAYYVLSAFIYPYKTIEIAPPTETPSFQTEISVDVVSEMVPDVATTTVAGATSSPTTPPHIEVVR